MRLLLIMAALLPVLVVVLGIDWVNTITTGEIIAIAISALMVLVAIAVWGIKQTSPNRVYKMALFDGSVDKLSYSGGSQISDYKIRDDKLVEIHAKITSRIGINIERIQFRLVKRECLWWKWISERPSVAYVERIWDKDLEMEKAIDSYQQSRRTPLYRQENESGVLILWDRRLLKGDVMWYRVIIHANNEWEGYLEYCAPSSDGRRACSRKKITLRLNPDKEDSRT